jgi:hypothetical protein
VRISVGDELRYRIVVRPSGPEGEPVPDRYDVTIENRNHSSMRRGDGSYVIPDIPPGHYTLVSMAWSQAQYLGQGERSFDVVDSDIMLRVQLGGLGEIAGNVQWDGAHNTDPKRALFMIESEEGAAQGVAVDDKGHFRISRVLPGKYTFKPLEVEPFAAPRSVKCEGKDVDTNTPLIIGDHGKVLDCKVTLVAP